MTPGMRALRESVALSEKDQVAVVRVEGPDAFDALDHLVSGELFAQSGRMRHTLLLREDGTPLADVYVCAADDDFILLAEGATGAELLAHLAQHRRHEGVRFHLVEDRAVLGIDGPYAWEVASEVLGPDALGLPYLTFYEVGAAVCFRAGKTGEYGFDLVVPRRETMDWKARILEAGRAFDLAACTLEDLDQCALENGFFNPRREGRSGATPLELQLQWRVSRRKSFVGSEALVERRGRGVRERLVCIAGPGPLAPGDVVALGGRPVGRVVNAGRCAPRGEFVGLALLESAVAHAGLEGFEAGDEERRIVVRTVSSPVVNNRSLYVQPQRHAYATRDEVRWPPLA